MDRVGQDTQVPLSAQSTILCSIWRELDRFCQYGRASIPVEDSTLGCQPEQPFSDNEATLSKCAL